MSFKNLVGELFGFNTEIRNWRNQLKICQSNLLNNKTNVKRLESKNSKLYDQIDLLNNQFEELKYSKVNKDLKKWIDKYPRVDLVYPGRYFGFDKDKKIKINPRILITPECRKVNDFLKKHELYYVNGSISSHVVKVYQKIKKELYYYVLDKNNYGVNEFWEFPAEVLIGLEKKYVKGFDCDSYSILIKSMLLASGVPDEYVRIVVGETYGKVGHATIDVFCEETKQFHHLNSTMGKWSSKNKLSDYPTAKEASEGKDNSYIKNVWFSFTLNNIYSNKKNGVFEVKVL